MKSESKITIYFMRHGFSMLNYMATIRPKEQNRFDPELIDCVLHEKGVQECKDATASINKYSNIKYVFISPLIRARQTAYLCTSSHPKKHDIKYYIHPLLREIVSRANDIPLLYTPLPDENASLEYFSESKNPYYYLTGLKYEHEMLEKAKGLTLPEYNKMVALKMSQLFPVNFETEAECHDRVDKFLIFVKEFAQKMNAKDGEILIVTHSEIIKIAKMIQTHTDKPDQVNIKNCYVLEFELKL